MPFPYTLPFNLGPKASELADDFTTKDTAKWAWSGTAAVSNGRAVLTPNASYTDTLISSNYDFTSSSASVRVAPPNAGNGTTEAYFNARIDSSNEVYFFWKNGTLYFREKIGGSVTETSVVYDAVAHRYWRIRESGGTVYWDTSPDGATWTNRRNKAAGLGMTSMFILLMTGHGGTEPSPGTAVFDDFNCCPLAETLTDDFTTLDTAAKWSAQGTAVATSGRLNLTYASPASQVQSQSRFDLTDSSASVRLTQVGTQSSSQQGDALLALWNAAFTRQIDIHVTNNLLVLRYYNGSTNSDTNVTYSSTSHAYLRIRETSGTLYWETSPTGATGSWTTQRSMATPFDVSSMQVFLGANLWGTGAAGEIAKFDDFNCNPLAETLTDDFTTQDTAKWNWSSAATTSGGQATFTPAGGSATLESTASYDLIGSSVFAEAASTGAASSTWFTTYAGTLNGTNYAAIYKSGTSLFFHERVAGTPDETSVTYSATTHRWWRIRESGGTIFWDTSPDGTTWTNRRSKVTTLNYTNCFVQVYADGASGTTIFDNVNLAPTVTNYNGSASTTTTIGLTSAGALGTVKGASTAVAVALTAAGAVGTSKGASTTATVGLTSAGIVGTSNGTSTTATVGLTSAGSFGVTAGASTAVAVGFTAAATTTGQALTTAIVSLTAAGIVGAATGSTTTVTIGRTAAGTVAVTGAASTPIAVGLTAVGGATGQASTTVAVGLAAAGTVDISTGAATAISVGRTATGAVAITSASTATAVATNLTGTGLTGTVGQTATGIAVGLSAAGAVATTAAATDTDIAVGLSAAGSSVAGVLGQADTDVAADLTADGLLAVSGAASQSVAVELTAAGVVGVARAATTVATVDLTASGGAIGNATTGIAAGVAAAGSVGTSEQATTGIAIGLDADGEAGAYSSATADIAIDLDAAGVVISGVAGGANTSVDVGLTADGDIATVGQANTDIATGLPASGSVDAHASASTPVTIGLSASGSVTVGVSSGVTTDVVIGLTAAGRLGLRSASEATPIAVGLTSAGIVHIAADAAPLTITAGLEAAGWVARTGDAATTVAVDLTATGVMEPAVFVADPEHTFLVPPGVHTALVAAASRITEVGAASRRFDVPGESHTAEVAEQSRAAVVVDV